MPCGGGEVRVSFRYLPAGETPLAAVEFRRVVLENREEFCTRSLFPDAEEVRLIDYARAAQEISFTGDDYVVIMTRGHKDDLLIQSQVMRTPVGYIRVIGSRQKTAASMAFADASPTRLAARKDQCEPPAACARRSTVRVYPSKIEASLPSAGTA